ncbi:MAG: LysR family transcriptional regulator, partial [Betaproteobacteria bacterium]|nr:LysR family transcriptional regulator [Betaproteobacteria bacterium]
MFIELRLLRHAIALGKHRNFARAAEALNLTQPTLSRSIATLEEALGVVLFDRSHKGVTPTPFGRVLLERGEDVVTGEFNLRREIQLLAGLEVGLLAIGAGPYASEVSVAAAVARVANAHPNLQIRVTTSDPVEVVRDVLAQRIDVGVAEVAGPDSDERLT